MNSHKMNELCANLEWDAFASGTISAPVAKLGDLSGDIGSVSVTRDSEYELTAEISADTDGSSLRREMERYRPGETPEGSMLVAGDERDRLELNHVFVASLTTSRREESTVTRAHLHLGRATRRFWSPDPPAVLAEWYISGPEPNTYARLTKREYGFTFSRRRFGMSADSEDAGPIIKPPPGCPPDSSSSRDYFLLAPAAGVRAMLSSVPKEHGPRWSRNVSIEYQSDALPEEAIRKALAEGIGVFFGRHILPIGETAFDSHGYPIASVGWSPWGRDAQSVSSGPDEPLFACDYRSTETSLNKFLTRYLGACDEFDLSSVAWTIWIARRVALGPDLALYAVAMERLMNGWFKSSRSKSGATYMPKDHFEALLGDELASAGRKLNDVAYGDRILRRLSSAFQMGVNERFQIFFDELGLKCSEGELQVIKARNRSAHGGDFGAPAEALRLSRAYRVLLNRAILKVLGHLGAYTDYSVVGHPEKPLQEPSGGSGAG